MRIIQEPTLDRGQLQEWYFDAMHELVRRLVGTSKRQLVDQSEIARRLGVSRQAIWQAFHGQGGISVASLSNIARAMGCRIEITFVPVMPTNQEEGH